MTDRIETDLCVIGAGSGGLSVAAGAVQMGARVVLVERGEMGGDCLNSGCVPSKSLIAAARRARLMRSGTALGVTVDGGTVDFAAVRDHVEKVIAGIAPHDSQERFEGLGVRVIRDSARFVDDRTIAAGGHRIRAKRFVIATGSRAAVPPIPGLADVPYLTNESVFDLTELARHLMIIGGGPIGVELGLAFRQLGAEVTLVEAAERPLAREDAEMAQLVIDRLLAEGVSLRTGAAVSQVDRDADGSIRLSVGGDSIVGDQLLVAAGRTPTTEGLDLDNAGVAFDKTGITTDARLRTTNRRIFAIGDVRGGYQYTHRAGADAGVVIRNALFRLPAKADDSLVPHVVYAQPELARLGLTEREAIDRHGGDAVGVFRVAVSENDRARALGVTDGLIKLVTAGGKPVGVMIASDHAADLIQPWSFVLSGKLKLSDMAGFMAPYPTMGELNKRVAGSTFTEALFSDRTRKIIRLLLKLP